MTQDAPNSGAAPMSASNPCSGLQTQSPLQRLFGAQSFWVTVALVDHLRR